MNSRAWTHAPTGHTFLEGPAGSGKTTLAVARLRALLEAGVPGASILVLAPQRTLLAPYEQLLRDPALPPGSRVDTYTLNGLARLSIETFWPLIGAEAGFGQPRQQPVFLTLETAQYFMERIAGPLIDQAGYFDGVTVRRNRLIGQLLSNLGRAALVGFPYTELVARLSSALPDPKFQRVYVQAQECAYRFRQFCRQNNLLDFSYQMELFRDVVWGQPERRAWLTARYRHLIVDNVEEDTPLAHDLLLEWLPGCASALVLYDTEAGYRSFLGADPASARRLRTVCKRVERMDQSFVTSPDLQALAVRLAHSLRQPAPPPAGRARQALRFKPQPFHPQMLDWVADEVARLVNDEGVPAREIVVLAPLLPDATLFALRRRLGQLGVQHRSHRPSRALCEQEAARCLLALAALAHPHWRLCPPAADVSHALAYAIPALDPVRAHLLAQIVYRPHDGCPALLAFDGLKPEVRERITYLAGEDYERLRQWLGGWKGSLSCAVGEDGGEEKEEGKARPQSLDHFWERLFGELLSQPRFTFHENLDAAQVAAELIASARHFRQVIASSYELLAGKTDDESSDAGREYLNMVAAGIVGAQYLPSWQDEEEDVDAVLLAPAYTFLMRNRAVDVQFWLDVGSAAWWERLSQPLTHPYVLSRNWPAGKVWRDEDEYTHRQEALCQLLTGLIRRCRRRVYLGLSELGEQGFEQRGPLLHAIQCVLRDTASEEQAVRS